MASTEIKFPFLDGLKTVPDHNKEDVKHIQQWLAHMPHLPPVSEDYIHLFLHSNYSQLERTKKTIENYYTIRTHATDIFAKRDIFDPAIQGMLGVTESAPAGCTPEGYCVWYNRLGDTDPSKMDFIAMVKLFFMLGDSLVSENGLYPGYVAVFDMKGVALSHLATISMSVIKAAMLYIQEGAPIRMKAIYVINAVPFMDRILSLIKPFMNPELHELLHIHTSTDILAKVFPPEAIPSDYGGTGESIAAVHAKYRKLLEGKYRPYLEKSSTVLVVDESKRVGKNSGDGKLFGAEGSFRTLSID